jgi:hypothetical protein
VAWTDLSYRTKNVSHLVCGVDRIEFLRAKWPTDCPLPKFHWVLQMIENRIGKRILILRWNERSQPAIVQQLARAGRAVGCHYWSPVRERLE